MLDIPLSSYKKKRIEKLLLIRYYLGLRDIYRQEIQQQQDKYTDDIKKWKDMERCLNLKLEEKEYCDLKYESINGPGRFYYFKYFTCVFRLILG